MTRETVNKLSQLIRDKDLEIQSLVARNESLVSLVHNKSSGNDNNKDHPDNVLLPETTATDSNKLAEEAQITLKDTINQLTKEKQDIYEALSLKHQESLNYYAEIERLNGVVLASQQQQLSNEQLQQQSTSSSSVSEKSVIDNSNEIIVLKARIKDLERRLNAEHQQAAGVKDSPSR